MKNSQKGFVVPLLIAIIAVLAIGGGIYIYENTKTEISTPTSAPGPVVSAPSPAVSASCSKFGALSDFVSKNIQSPDSQNTIPANKNVIASFRWRRNSAEPFVSYPIIQGTVFAYGYNASTTSNYRSDSSISSLTQTDVSRVGAGISAEANALGFSSDTLNTIKIQYFPYGSPSGNPADSQGGLYRSIFGFQQGADLYSIVFEGSSSHQAPGGVTITVTCGQAVSQYNKVYTALNLKADTSVKDMYGDDYVAVGEVSPDNQVYALLGSSNQVRIANYYYFDGTTIKLVSKDSYPAECTVLEAEKVGQGMRCVNVPSYIQGTVNYSSTPVTNTTAQCIPEGGDYGAPASPEDVCCAGLVEQPTTYSGTVGICVKPTPSSPNSSISPITVISPNGGESLVIGQSYQIKWVPNSTKVNILLNTYDQNGNQIGNGQLQWIAQAIDNSGVYNWTPSTSALTLSTAYKYKIRITKANDLSYNASDMGESVGFFTLRNY